MTVVRAALSVAFWAFPVFFLFMWTCSRVVAYFFMDYEWNKKDFADVVLPDDIGHEVPERFHGLQAAFFDPGNIKYYAIRLHTLLGAVMGFMCIIQLLPFMRRRFMKLHRTLGYLYCALLVPFSVEVLATLHVIGAAPLGPVVAVGNSVSLAAMLVGTSVGVWAAKNHKVSLHRACMLINCAGLYVNPAQRFFWALISKNNVFGPYQTWTAWIDWAMTPAELAAIAACFGTALAYITVITPARQGKRRDGARILTAAGTMQHRTRTPPHLHVA